MRLRDGVALGALRAAVPAVAAWCLYLHSAPANAGEVCALTVRAQGLEESWTRELGAVRANLARREDVDQCASILLERAASGARMIVVLTDGRSTERAVSDPLDLRAIATAVVLLPSPPPSPVIPAVENAPQDLNRAAERSASAIDGSEPTASPRPLVDRTSRTGSQGRIRIDLGGIGGARWSGAAPAGAVGLFAEIRLDDWVLGAHGRWDSYAMTSEPNGYTTQALEVGAEVGRNLRLGTTSLTLLAGPSYLALSQKLVSPAPSLYVSEMNPKTDAPIGLISPSARDGQVVRLGGAARWTVVSRARVRLFFAADAEVDVMQDPGNRVPAAFAATSPLPLWSAGLSLGGAVSVWP